MPTATLTFDLTDPDDIRSHLECIKASDVIIAIDEFNNFLRGKLKYDDTLTAEQYKVYETVSDRLHEIVNDADLANLIFN